MNPLGGSGIDQDRDILVKSESVTVKSLGAVGTIRREKRDVTQMLNKKMFKALYTGMRFSHKIHVLILYLFTLCT